MTENKPSNSGYSKYCSCLLIILITGFIVILAPIYYTYLNINYTSPTAAQLNIAEGDGSSIIGQKLAAQKIVKSDLFFEMYAFYTEDFQYFQPGSYFIPAGSNLDAVLAIITSPLLTDVSLTFPEGIKSDEIVTILAEKIKINADDLYSELEKSTYRQTLPIEISGENNKLEGFLFPDTYVFSLDSTPADIVTKCLDNFQIKWESLKNNQTELSDYDILILASVIEKEAANQEERKIISGILHDRLKYDIPLGVNSSINYILDKPEAFFSSGENNIDSPYNTYLNAGLPPSPICNPGLDSIRAALNPEYTDYVFYLHTPDGEIKYAKTLEEHNANIAKYY